jgi:hypothetical protein
MDCDRRKQSSTGKCAGTGLIWDLGAPLMSTPTALDDTAVSLSSIFDIRLDFIEKVFRAASSDLHGSYPRTELEPMIGRPRRYSLQSRTSGSIQAPRPVAYGAG